MRMGIEEMKQKVHKRYRNIGNDDDDQRALFCEEEACMMKLIP